MSDDAATLVTQEYRVASRLARLFRIERSGRFSGRSSETVRRLIERRGRLVDTLARLDATRRSLVPWKTAELDLAMGELKREVDSTEQCCLELLAELGEELRRRRGVVAATGLRDGACGQLLGHG
jgi:hypothetical protein